MILYIAEKPALARAIAAVLPKPQYKDKGFIRLANGDVVSWCIGHLLEQAEPQDYNPDYKRWQTTHLPIVPQKWQLKVRKSAEQQLNVLKKLLKQADSLVHAGDPDREGQLLVDEVLAYCGVSGARLATTQRLLISDLNPPAVKRALNQLKPNKDFVPLSTSALARSRADWLYGLNMTRAYTLQGQKAGYKGVLSVGRVQTPLLGLVVRRDQEIANFVSKPFYQVVAELETADKQRFTALWQPSAACAPWQDEEGRVLLKALAEKVQQKISGQPAIVSKLQHKDAKQAAPLPYNLSALQIDAAKRFSMTAQQVLDSCQQLYERHKLITYPRSDSRYLPKEQLKQAVKVCDAIAANDPDLAAAVQEANTKLISKAWNDSKVEAHHAIIPTEKRLPLTRLSVAEQRLYQLIARQYLAQFYPPFCYSDAMVELTIAGGCFIAKARTEKAAGWKQLFRRDNIAEPLDKQADPAMQQAALPPLQQGQQLLCTASQLLEKHTQPPQAFTDASLLAAMTGISRYVKDEAVRKILRDTDGLGTDATRAGIIELLFKRGFLQRKGKQINATDTGKALIAAVPAQASLPDMTARWEAALNAICQREQSYQAFMQPLIAELSQLVHQAASVTPSGLPQQNTRQWRGSKSPATAKRGGGRRKAGNRATTKRN
ncbi:DNA topoisomerase III [Rheinheimera sp. YQF-2]|uniref:DNA topoisomerase 3 n=1 Tax=Rheinheimera lutimaris TaxID=2740584 RepID=A0A7Y5EK65_9GAMM|nr:DNA topoisomerase III [Rheinheimera lutimaris]NRQ41788.1 DNA topoisomerase III [Rheinheimera lutimaris]